MIERTLEFLLTQLNAHLSARFPTGEAHVVLSGLAKQDGSVADDIANRIVLTVVNIERETIIGGLAPKMQRTGEDFGVSNPPLHLNLYLLLSASFENNYPESFKLLSAVLAYFQANPYFTPAGGADFPKGLEKLNLEIVNLGFQELNNLWAGLSGKYLPSVLYKARMLTVDEGWLVEQVPAVTGTETKV